MLFDKIEKDNLVYRILTIICEIPISEAHDNGDESWS